MSVWLSAVLMGAVLMGAVLMNFVCGDTDLIYL